MSKFTIWKIGGEFPFLHRMKCLETSSQTAMRGKLVRLQDQRVGLIDHIKSDGKVAVRPINLTTGEFYPNRSEHMSDEQRKAIPEELSVNRNELRDVESGQVVPL